MGFKKKIAKLLIASTILVGSYIGLDTYLDRVKQAEIEDLEKDNLGVKTKNKLRISPYSFFHDGKELSTVTKGRTDILGFSSDVNYVLVKDDHFLGLLMKRSPDECNFVKRSSEEEDCDCLHTLLLVDFDMDGVPDLNVWDEQYPCDDGKRKVFYCPLEDATEVFKKAISISAKAYAKRPMFAKMLIGDTYSEKIRETAESLLADICIKVQKDKGLKSRRHDALSKFEDDSEKYLKSVRTDYGGKIERCKCNVKSSLDCRAKVRIYAEYLDDHGVFSHDEISTLSVFYSPFTDTVSVVGLFENKIRYAKNEKYDDSYCDSGIYDLLEESTAEKSRASHEDISSMLR